MTRELLILRHAKSSWADEYTDDWERPLTERGLRDAARVGAFLRERSLMPDLIITSDAVRAETTAQGAADAARYSGKIAKASSLYHAPPHAVIDVIRTTAPSTARRIMIVAHNPGLEDLVTQLTGQRVGLATASLVHVELKLQSWDAIDLTGDATLRDSWHPDDM